jgi:glycine cleavage system regulatory protein
MVAEGGPLAWLDTLLTARNDLLEAEVADAVRQAREASAAFRVAVDAQLAAEAETARLRIEMEQAAADARVVAEAEAARLRHELKQAQRAVATERHARLSAEGALYALQDRRHEESVSRSWDLVRRLEAALVECTQKHGVTDG